MPSIDLSPAVRCNLEAIRLEFERCARTYPPLYHRRIIPWSDFGEVPISQSQWQAFQDSQQELPEDLPWFEWDGPNRHYLGMWIGEKDGLEEFTNLVESLASVFRSESPVIDGLNIDFHSSDWCEWLPLLHEWAFSFQMPLLRSRISLWGASSNLDEFDELVGRWEADGIRMFPKHPLMWQLVDNVFTSSVAAIQAILSPDTVISSENPWVSETAHSQPIEAHPGFEQREQQDHHSHKLSFRKGWFVEFADDDEPRYYAAQAGLTRIAHLIADAPTPIKAQQLYSYGARNFSRALNIDTSSHQADDLTEHTSLDCEQDQDDYDARKQVEEELLKLNEERRVAKKNDDHAEIGRLDKLVQIIEEEFHVDGTRVKRQRPFPKPQTNNCRKAVKKTILDALKAVAADRQAVADELAKQIQMESEFAFIPNESCTPWKVVWK